MNNIELKMHGVPHGRVDENGNVISESWDDVFARQLRTVEEVEKRLLSGTPLSDEEVAYFVDRSNCPNFVKNQYSKWDCERGRCGLTIKKDRPNSSGLRCVSPLERQSKPYRCDFFFNEVATLELQKQCVAKHKEYIKLSWEEHQELEERWAQERIEEQEEEKRKEEEARKLAERIEFSRQHTPEAWATSDAIRDLTSELVELRESISKQSAYINKTLYYIKLAILGKREEDE